MTMTTEEANEFYGATAAEWLTRWNDGRSVWTVEMGGLGPGYEQALQIAATRMVAWYVKNEPDAAEWEDQDNWRANCDRIENDVDISDLGLSGAQWGAALSLATRLYRDGPAKCLTHESLPDDRRIQISRNFPTEAPA